MQLPPKVGCQQIMQGVAERGNEFTSRSLAGVELSFGREILQGLVISVNVERFFAGNKQLLLFLQELYNN
jgi:hypothetical protein